MQPTSAPPAFSLALGRRPLEAVAGAVVRAGENQQFPLGVDEVLRVLLARSIRAGSIPVEVGPDQRLDPGEALVRDVEHSQRETRVGNALSRDEVCDRGLTGWGAVEVLPGDRNLRVAVPAGGLGSIHVRQCRVALGDAREHDHGDRRQREDQQSCAHFCPFVYAVVGTGSGRTSTVSTTFTISSTGSTASPAWRRIASGLVAW